MFKFTKLFSLLLIFSAVLLAPSVTIADGPSPATGSGTVEDPYVITDVDELNLIRNNLSTHYILGNNINASATETWNEDPENPGTYFGFEPIGDNMVPFTGTLDGRGYVITDLYIDLFSEFGSYVGLFGFIGDSGLIDNLRLEDISISSWNYLGGLAGYNYGTITRSYTTGSVVGGGAEVGGLVGGNYGDIENSYSTASVSSNPELGAEVGGLVGVHYDGVVNNSYATGEVAGARYVGGLIGMNVGTVSNSYSTGNVSGNEFVGGLTGISEYPPSNSFWDTEASGQETSAGGTGKTTEEMKNVATFTDTSTEGLDDPWDFIANPNDDEADENIWHISPGINDGYPFLVSFYNNSPNIPENLGPENLTDGSVTELSNPQFTFDLSDPDNNDTIRFQIQIATLDDFSSLVVDYISTLSMEGERSFTIGQGGSYVVGEEGQTLSEGDYYWRVRALDDFGSFSDWVMANDGEIAFEEILSFTGEGSGTLEDPYVITTVDELQLMASDLSAHYILGNDIDASATETWNDGAGFVTIGDSDNQFTGSIDGQGHVISNLHINRPEEYNRALIYGLGEAGEIMNLGLDNVNFIGLSTVAGLVGDSFGTISGVYVSGSLFGSMAVAGLVDRNMGGNISNSYFEGSIESAEVWGVGLVRENYGTITNTYSTGPISVEFFGLCGLVCSDNYSSEEGPEFSGITNSFWDTETSGVTESDGGTGKTTADMKTLATFTDWDIVLNADYVNETWFIDEGNDYPRLGWQWVEPEPEPEPEPTPRRSRRPSFAISTPPPVVPPTSPTPTPPVTGLTSNQIQSTLNFLRALNLDSQTIARVEAALTGGSTPSPSTEVTSTSPAFTRDLSLNSQDPDVLALQVFLNTNGFPLANQGPGSPGHETNRFGPLTQSALIRFQQANNLTPALGYFGPVTRGVVNSF